MSSSSCTSTGVLTAHTVVLIVDIKLESFVSSTSYTGSIGGIISHAFFFKCMYYFSPLFLRLELIHIMLLPWNQRSPMLRELHPRTFQVINS